MTIEPDEFTNWREHPVTRVFLAKIASECVRSKDMWIKMAWLGGNLSEKEYAYFKSRADTLEYVEGLEFEDLFPKEAE